MYYARLTKEFAKYEPTHLASKSPHDRRSERAREHLRDTDSPTINAMNNVVARAERLTGIKSSKYSSSRHHNGSSYKNGRSSRHSSSYVTERDRERAGLPPLSTLKREGTLKRQSRGLNPLPVGMTLPRLKYGREPTIPEYNAKPLPKSRTTLADWSMSVQKESKPKSSSQRIDSTIGFSVSTPKYSSHNNNRIDTHLTRQLKDHSKKYNLDSTHRQLKYKYDEALADARSVKEKYKETKVKLAEITARLQSERTLLGRMHDEFTKLHSKHVKLHEKHDSHRKEAKHLRKEEDDRRAELLLAKQNAERMTAELEAEKAKNAELQQKLKNTARDNEGTRNKINKAMDIIRKMKDELARYRRKHRELKAKYQVIKEKYQVAQMNHKDLSIMKQDVRRDLEKEFRREIESLKKSHKEEIHKLESQLQQDRAFASNLVKSKDSYITRLQEHNRLLQQHLKLIKQALEHRLMGLEEESRAMTRDIIRIRNSMNAPGAAAPPPAAKRGDRVLKQAENWLANRFTTQCHQIKRQIDTISTIVESEGPSTIRTDITSLAGTVRSVMQPGEMPKRDTPTPKPSFARKITPRRAPTPTPNPNLGPGRPTGAQRSQVAAVQRFQKPGQMAQRRIAGGSGPGAAPGSSGLAGMTRPW